MGQEILAQSKQALFKGYGKSVTGQSEYYSTDSGFMVIRHYILGCKNFATDTVFHKYRPKPIVYVGADVVPVKQSKLLSVHGSVSYDFYYRSRLDTPFVQRDLQQHTERIWLDILVKEKYPFRIGFTARESNSPFFKNLFNANLIFDRLGYTKIKKEELLNRITKVRWQNPNLRVIDSILKQQQARYEALKHWLNQPAVLQRIIEERERLFLGKTKQIENLNAMTLKDARVPGRGISELANSKALDSANSIKSSYLSLTSDSVRLVDNTKVSSVADSLILDGSDSLITRNDFTYAKMILKKKRILGKSERSIATLRQTPDSINNKASHGLLALRQKIYKKSKAKSSGHRLNINALDSVQFAKTSQLSSYGDSAILPGNKKKSSQSDSLIAKSSDSSIKQEEYPTYAQIVLEKRNELTKLEKSIANLKHSSDSIKNKLNFDVSSVKQAIYKARNAQELAKIEKSAGVVDSNKNTLQNFLANIRSFSLGRSVVDYTELTAQNVIVAGISLEYNPSYYGAIAAGTVDYGFRDVFGRKKKQSNQYLLLGRFGWGSKDRNALILTVFNGRKNNYSGLFTSDSLRPASQLFGYSVETIIRKNEDNFFSAEIAKSTKNLQISQSVNSSKSDDLFKFSDNTNMGFNIKAQTRVALTKTKLSGFFRKTGEAFQSFSLFTYNTNQQAWQLRADQTFFKGQINLSASLRQNDFTNPFTDKTFKTSTIFKSFQVNVRRPHWPVISAGYFPGTQLYVVDQLTIRENAYYVLNGSVLYPYILADLTMNSSFIYNRYFNKATDSGFVLYKGVNYILSQAAKIKSLQLEASYSYNQQSELTYYTMGAEADYGFSRILRIGVGTKYNQLVGAKAYWGKSMRLGMDIKKLGALQFQYEKSFLPTIQQTLYPVEIGRVSWYKTF